MIKIARITTLNTGGAGLCVQRLHTASILSGNDETLLLRNGKLWDDNTIIVKQDKHFVLKSQKWFFQFLYRRFAQLGILGKTHYYLYRLSKLKNARDFFITLPVSFYKGLSTLDCVKNADIINLHWIGDFIDFPSFFKETKKPIIWTLHDENAARGGLHYDCPYPEYNNFDKELKKIKRKILNKNNNLHIVVQSKYMERVCKSSKILEKYPITIIPNGVVLKDFIALDKFESRQRLCIDNDKLVFIFSSVFLEDKRKGLSLLIKALERLDNPKVMLICVGEYHKVPKTGIEVKCMGFVSDYHLYSQLYSAADFYVLSSFQESFAKTPLESMACGTPVIAFPCSGIEDCVTKETGVICKDFTIDSLYDGIKVALSRKYDKVHLRKYIENNFTFEIMAEKYNQLYKSILEESKGKVQ